MRPSEMPIDRQHKMRILIIEDEPILALDLEQSLADAGFAIVGVATRLAKALELIECSDCDAAILDGNLAGVSSEPAAAALAARGVPFLVMSGYSATQLHADFPTAPFIQKPSQVAHVIAALSTILPKR